MPSSTVFTDMERDDGDSRPLHIAMEQLTVFGLEDAQLRRGLEAECPPSPPLPPSTAAAVAGGGGPVAGPLLLQGSPQGAAPCPCPCPCPAGPAGLPLVSSVLALFEAEQIQQQQQQPRKKSVNMTECVPVPSSEHVAEIVGRQGCKIKALRAKTNTYIKTPVRGEEPVFIVTGRKEDVAMAKREILSAAEHFSMIRASRNKTNGLAGTVAGSPNLPGQTTIQVRVPYRVVGLVVGPKGATIKRIQQTTHTYIVTPSRDKEPVFEVTGMPENVDRAREEIEAHISMRTGVLIDLTADNDFHSNGTDVSLDGISTTGSLWSKAPNPARRPAASFRNDSLSSLGSTSTDSYYSNRLADTSPTSPFSTGSGGFTFGESLTSVNADERDVGLEYPAIDCLSGPHSMIWSPFEHGNPIQVFNGGATIQRRTNSIGGSSTLRVSPTISDGSALDHPLARRVQSDPLANLAWLPNQTSLSAFSNSPGYSSSSLPGSTSATSGSPTDSSGSESRQKNNRDCVVCRESEVIAALVPCGHNYFCMECANRICEKTEPKCPVCQKPASQAIRIFS